MSGRERVLAGSHNVRDLGGLPTADGGRVRPGAVFRADYPAFADGAADGPGGDAVRTLGLRTVVDLRRGTEAAFECVRWEDHGVTYHRCPVTAGSESSWRARYPAYLSARPETVVEAVRQVLDPANHPVLFHCAAGKDRTGVVAALVLGVLGVPEEAIVEDYVASAATVRVVLERLRRRGPYVEMLADATDESQTPRAESIAFFLDHLRSLGGARQWLVERGLGAAEVDRAREALVLGS